MIDPVEVSAVRDASRRLVRELGFLNRTLAGSQWPPSAVHALIEIGARGSTTASELGDVLLLEKSGVSRMLGKLIEGGEITSQVCDEDGRAKRLALTDRGRRTLEDIDAFGRAQVVEALRPLLAPTRACVSEGVSAYADALAARRNGSAAFRQPIEIVRGYRAGLLGRAVEMHARFYARSVGFGRVFERKVAAEMAEFVGRWEAPKNELWSATIEGAIVGTVAIDGEDLGGGNAHLRWFIVEDGLRGAGIGRKLLAEAVAFCDAQGFAETHLWTFRGLDAARRLYESNGFVLIEEEPGCQWGEQVVEQRFVRPAASPVC
jgi:DNA-binding MarR family transcriptional regulator/ribosomal protein S18 acetylase RimI-like enzyme